MFTEPKMTTKCGSFIETVTMPQLQPMFLIHRDHVQMTYYTNKKNATPLDGKYLMCLNKLKYTTQYLIIASFFSRWSPTVGRMTGSRTFRTIDVSFPPPPPRRFAPIFKKFIPVAVTTCPSLRRFPPVSRFAPTEDLSPPM